MTKHADDTYLMIGSSNIHATAEEFSNKHEQSQGNDYHQTTI